MKIKEQSLMLLLCISASALSVSCSQQPSAAGNMALNEDAQKSNPLESEKPSSIGASRESNPAFNASNYMCNSDACKSDYLSASSGQEARWLRMNGFPSRSELLELESLSDDQLKRLATAGSSAAKVVYGKRLSLAGDTANGIGEIIRAAEFNSIFAYYGMSEVFSKSVEVRDNIDAAAYLRLAYILGDTKAATALQANFPDLGPAENRLVDDRAASLYQTFAKSKKPNPRPI